MVVSVGLSRLTIWFVLSTVCLARQRFDIYWNSSNSIFRIDNTDHVFTARIRDRLDIHCPLYNDTVLEEDTEQAVIYRVNKYGYDNCWLGAGAVGVGRCNTPYEKSLITINLREFSPLPHQLEFSPGESYYFISASHGMKEGIEMKADLCQETNMKIRFDILPSERTRSTGIQGQTVPTIPPDRFSPRWRNRISNTAKSVHQESGTITTTVVPDLNEFFQKLNQQEKDLERKTLSNTAPLNEGPDWWLPNSAPTSDFNSLPKPNGHMPLYEIRPQGGGENEEQLLNTRYFGLSDEGRDDISSDIPPTREHLVLYSIEEIGERSNSGFTVDIRWSLLWSCSLSWVLLWFLLCG